MVIQPTLQKKKKKEKIIEQPGNIISNRTDSVTLFIETEKRQTYNASKEYGSSGLAIVMNKGQQLYSSSVFMTECTSPYSFSKQK